MFLLQGLLISVSGRLGASGGCVREALGDPGSCYRNVVICCFLASLGAPRAAILPFPVVLFGPAVSLVMNP